MASYKLFIPSPASPTDPTIRVSVCQYRLSPYMDYKGNWTIGWILINSKWYDQIKYNLINEKNEILAIFLADDDIAAEKYAEEWLDNHYWQFWNKDFGSDCYMPSVRLEKPQVIQRFQSRVK